MAMDKNEARRKKDRFATAGLLVLFTILAVLIILPIYAIFLASFKPGGHLLQYGLNPVSYTHLDVYKRQLLRKSVRNISQGQKSSNGTSS